MNKKFSICIWDKLNVIFLLFSIVTFIPFVIFLTLSFINTENSFALGMGGIFASLFSAFLISIVVRVVDFKKKKDNEEKALLMLNGHLESIFTEIQTFFPQIKSFVKINENHTVELPKGIVYYTNIENAEIFDFIDFKEEFLLVKNKLDKKIKLCINSPFFMQCNIEVINLITNLQTNGFTRNLHYIATTHTNISKEQVQYGFIFTEEKEFESLYVNLTLLLKRKPFVLLRELTEDEKNEYLKFIEQAKRMIKDYNLSTGRKYLGSKRIA